MNKKRQAYDSLYFQTNVGEYKEGFANCFLVLVGKYSVTLQFWKEK